MADTNTPQGFSQTRSPSGSGLPDRSWKSLYKLGGTTALMATLLIPAEIAISFFPSVEHATAYTVTVVDWFNLFQNSPFIALRNLGLLNIIGAILLAPTIFAAYSALKREREAYAALGTILFFVGIAVYLASSRAFPMLSLSRQYMIAPNDAQRSLLVSAGQAMLAEGQSRSGILIIEFGCLVVSLVMLKGHAFSTATACAGTLGNVLMIVLEMAFLPPRGVGMIVEYYGRYPYGYVGPRGGPYAAGGHRPYVASYRPDYAGRSVTSFRGPSHATVSASHFGVMGGGFHGGGFSGGGFHH